MTIVAYSQRRSGIQTEIIATSNLTGKVFFHWYVDGEYFGRTNNNRRAFAIASGDESHVDVLDTTDAAFDPVANAPASYPARYTIFWVKSLDADVEFYRVEQKKDSDAWAILGRVQHDAGTWQYRFLSDRLVDLASYQWRVVPVDISGNDGTPLTLGPITVVRSPDAPSVSATFNAADSKVTFDVEP